MNILFYPSWYQTNEKHNNGIFFKDQAEAVARYSRHNVVMLITNIRWQNYKYGIPVLKFSERKENELIIWEYLLSLPTVFRRVRVQEWFYQKMLRMAIRKMKYRFGDIDLIHAQSFLKAGYDACKLKSRYKIPVMTTEHLSSVANGLAPHAKQRFLYTMQESDKVISVSNFLDSIIKEYLPDRDKRLVIPNVVSEDFYYDSKVRKTDIFTFISVGHLIAGKRVDILIDGFAKTFANNEGVQLLIIGDGNQRGKLEEQVLTIGRSNQIKFLGSLTHDEVCEQMKKVHVLVHTSRLETFGVVLVEALASGLPIVCTRCGGPEDILSNYGCTAIEVDNTNELIDAMRHVYDEYSSYDFEKISQCAINRFGGKIISNDINAVYESIVKRRKDR